MMQCWDESDEYLTPGEIQDATSPVRPGQCAACRGTGEVHAAGSMWEDCEACEGTGREPQAEPVREVA